MLIEKEYAYMVLKSGKREKAFRKLLEEEYQLRKRLALAGDDKVKIATLTYFQKQREFLWSEIKERSSKDLLNTLDKLTAIIRGQIKDKGEDK